MNRVQALVVTSHPGPSLAITALTALLAAQAAPHGIGPALTALPRCSPGSCPSAGRTTPATPSEDTAAKPACTSRSPAATSAGGAVWAAAWISAALGLALALAISPLTAALYVLVVAPGWAYNLGLKATLGSGVMYLLGFGPRPPTRRARCPGTRHRAGQW